jgi:hypothetical protein
LTTEFAELGELRDDNMPDPGRPVSKVSRAALVAGVARALEEYDERPVTAPLSDDQRRGMAIAEIERVRPELRLEQALGEIERAADNLRTLAGLQVAHLVGPWWKRLAS